MAAWRAAIRPSATSTRRSACASSSKACPPIEFRSALSACAAVRVAHEQLAGDRTQRSVVGPYCEGPAKLGVRATPSLGLLVDELDRLFERGGRNLEEAGVGKA